MAKFCENCGRPLNEEESCFCQPTTVSNQSSATGANNVQNFFYSLWRIVLAFSKNPIHVVCEHANSKNWMAASVFILITAIFQGVAAISVYSSYQVYGYIARDNGTIFFKTFVIELLLFGAIAFALFCFSRLFNRSNSDLVKTYTAIGISAIPLAAAAIVISILNLAFTDLTLMITDFARAFTLVCVILAMKNIDKIHKEELLVFIGAFTAASFGLVSIILNKLFY